MLLKLATHSKASSEGPSPALDTVTVHPVLLLRDPDPAIAADGSFLPMACLISYAKTYKEGKLNQHFDFRPLANRQAQEYERYLEETCSSSAPDIWLFSSYVWNHEVNLKFAEKVRQARPEALIIFGGPHVPAYEGENRDFLQQHTFIDITARGEGEITLSELFELIADHGGKDIRQQDFSEIPGITFRKSNGELFRTADRPRSNDLSIFPSPYLSGELDDASFDGIHLTILETNRGCPFGCTFCDWGSATLQKFAFFDLERIKEEIHSIGRRQIHTLYLGDSNFGAFERDIEIAKTAVEAKKLYGFPKKLGSSFAKNASPRLAKIIKILNSANMIDAGLISIQTTDQTTLEAINRDNIRNDKYEQLIEIFRSEGLVLSSELLIGLPGQTVESHRKDLQHFFDRKLPTIAYGTSVMPNAPMNEPSYREKYQLKTNPDGFIVSTSTLSEAEQQHMFLLFLSFQFFYVLGVLKYYLYYLQMEHDVKALDFIAELLNQSKHSDAYPLNKKLQETLLVNKHHWSPVLAWSHEESEFLFDHIDDYYQEILCFTREQFQVEIGESERNTLLTAQKAVMPATGKVVPLSVELPHDLATYISQVKNTTVVDHQPEGFKPLKTFSPTTLPVRTRKNHKIENLSLTHFNRYTGAGWELKSPLRFF